MREVRRAYLGRIEGTERLRVARIVSRMSRRDEIDRELEQLRRLERHMTDEKILNGIKELVADLEAEKAELQPTKH